MLIMDFLSYSVENRGSAFLDDIEFPIDVIVRNKNLVKNLEMKDLYDLDKDLLDLDRETVYDIGFVETVFAHDVRKSILDSPCLGVSSGEISDGSINKVPSTSEFNLDHSTKELGFGTDLSGTIFGLNNGNESMIDLKLEKCTDPKEVSSMLSSEESLISALVEDSLPAKRVRANCLYPQIPICQVQGCYKDLSSAKEYYKRHRVCDGHSKSAKVVINGIEQRFCQQCSRFHFLSEFDDGKRSCRKRLTGHNERRRKPQLSAHFGSTFFEMTLPKSECFLSPETLPGSFYYQERNMSSDHGKRIKLEEVPIGISQLAITAKERSPSKSFSGTCNDAAVLSDSHCGALYLLSTKSHKSPRNSTGFTMTNPKNARENQGTRIGVDQKFMAQLGTSGINNSSGTKHFSSGIQDKAGSAVVHGRRPDVCSALRKDRFVQSSDYNCCMHCASPEVGSTVDLLQLSSHLQRVEQLKISMQMKQENHSLC